LIDDRVHRLLNDSGHRWSDFCQGMREQGITIWGAAIDTLENTSRFARGEERGPMTVLHLSDQPLAVSRPYESYMGILVVPAELTRVAREHAIHVDLLTPRRKLVEAIEIALPGIRREHIHVWTLAGKSRQSRLEGLWNEWRDLGAHLGEDGWTAPTGVAAFNESGPTRPSISLAPGRTAAALPTSSYATGTPPPPRPCRRPASRRPSTWTFPWPTARRASAVQSGRSGP